MTKALMPMPKQAFYGTVSGVFGPVVGGKVYTYSTGTNTPKTTYTTQAGGTQNANPVILDARGEASIWLDSGAYRIKLCDANDAEVWTQDGISGGGGSGSSAWVNVKDFPYLATGDGATDDTVALQAAIDACLLTGQTLYIPAGIYMFSALSIVSGTTGVGPLKIVGDSAPAPFTTATRGTILRQIAGTTSTAFTLTGDWGTNPNRAIFGITLQDFGIQTSAACTGWAIDAINLTNRHNYLLNMSIAVPNAGAAGGVRLRSCWSVTITDIEMRGPGSGTSRGLVMYGDAQGSVSDGTSNMIVIQNPNIQYFGDCNMQLGKWSETGGGFAHAYKVIGGQVGHAVKYGLVVGRIMDLDVDTLHTEVNGYSGILLDDDGGGVDPFRIKIVADCYNDGMSASADAADSYAVQVNRGSNVFIDVRTQEQRAGIYIADSADAKNITIGDQTHFGGKSNGSSRIAVHVANSTPDVAKRVTMGMHTFGYTWSSAAVSGAADNGSGLIRITATGHIYATGDEVTITGVAGTVEANGHWVVTVIDADTFDLDGSAFATAYTSGGTATRAIKNPKSISFRRMYDVDTANFDDNRYLEVYPWTASLSLYKTAKAITNVVDNGSGLCRVTSASHGYATGDTLLVSTVNGVPLINRDWVITRIDANTYDLVGSTLSGAYTSGGQAEKIRFVYDIIPFTNYCVANGQEITIYFNDNAQKIMDVSDGGNFRLNSGTSWRPKQYDSLTVVNQVGVFVERARTYGSGSSSAHTLASNARLDLSPGIKVVYVNASGAVTITDFYDGGGLPDGHTVKLIFANGNATINNTSTIKLLGAANWSASDADDTLTLTHYNGVLYEDARSVN